MHRCPYLGMLLCLLAPLSGSAQTLVGVTGDGDINAPETLYTLDPGDASITFLMTLGNGDDGETIGFNPDDGLLYHASGRTAAVWESIDTSVPEIVSTGGFSSDGTPSENTAMVHDPATGRFLVVDSDDQIFDTTLAGVGTLVGSAPENLKGLAFSGGVLYATSRVDQDLFELDPADGSVLSTRFMTYLGDAIIGTNGLTTHPQTDELWLVFRPDGSTDRHLGVVDPSTGVLTSVGALPAKFAGIAFLPEPSAATARVFGLAAVLAAASLRRRTLRSD